MVFDDSFEHEVLHEGDEARTVLLVNFWHPDVPPEMFTGNAPWFDERCPESS